MEQSDAIHAFAYVAASGEQVRGAPGVVWVDSAGGSARYLVLSEVEPEQLRLDVARMIEEDEDANYFILHKDKAAVHVFKYEKARLARECA